jgi:hypothetical protein
MITHPREIMKDFDSLSEREILALAISLEEEDERAYADFARTRDVSIRELLDDLARRLTSCPTGPRARFSTVFHGNFHTSGSVVVEISPAVCHFSKTGAIVCHETAHSRVE